MRDDFAHSNLRDRASAVQKCAEVDFMIPVRASQGLQRLLHFREPITGDTLAIRSSVGHFFANATSRHRLRGTDARNTMSDLASSLPSSVYSALTSLLQAWSRRNEWSAARDVQSLVFWRDGMLKYIAKIAEGTATIDDFSRLRYEYETTRHPVEITFERLRALRPELTIELNQQIDKILNDYNYGKGSIRTSIFELTTEQAIYRATIDINNSEQRNVAKMLRNDIEILNREIQKLYDMVYPSWQHC
jgi:hypothetical protein